MSRRDDHLDAMLRHLGAAYYESLHGRASTADVARALDSVEEHTGDRHPGAAKAAGKTGAASPHVAPSSIMGAGTTGSGTS